MKLRRKRIVGVVLVTVVIVIGLFFLFSKKESVLLMPELIGKSREEVEEYTKKNALKLQVEEVYDTDTTKGKVIEQEIEKGKKLLKGETIKVVVSLGEILKEVYQEKKVNELGRVPIMMYHGIVNMPSTETKYVGGNVDKDGYNRTAEAFRKDLELYYESGYRMIRLTDYMQGKIDVPLGYSPIVLTFDDGREDNFKVLGKDANGELQIDPNCAIGILESMKQKYPDYGVTATFFVNSGLFQQKEYNEDILKWLVQHGYDVGNHTTTHPDFTKITYEKSVEVVGKVYQQLDALIPGQYVKVIALPFGSPYKKTHANFEAILKGTFEGYSYSTEGALRVGWEADVSPFAQAFDPLFLKRIRAYDNDGKEFDIQASLKQIEKTKYISDGNPDTIVVAEGNLDKVKHNAFRRLITY